MITRPHYRIPSRLILAYAARNPGAKEELLRQTAPPRYVYEGPLLLTENSSIRYPKEWCIIPPKEPKSERVAPTSFKFLYAQRRAQFGSHSRNTDVIYQETSQPFFSQLQLESGTVPLLLLMNRSFVPYQTDVKLSAKEFVPKYDYKKSSHYAGQRFANRALATFIAAGLSFMAWTAWPTIRNYFSTKNPPSAESVSLQKQDVKPDLPKPTNLESMQRLDDFLASREVIPTPNSQTFEAQQEASSTVGLTQTVLQELYEPNGVLQIAPLLLSKPLQSEISPQRKSLEHYLESNTFESQWVVPVARILADSMRYSVLGYYLRTDQPIEQGTWTSEIELFSDEAIQTSPQLVGATYQRMYNELSKRYDIHSKKPDVYSQAVEGLYTNVDRVLTLFSLETTDENRLRVLNALSNKLHIQVTDIDEIFGVVKLLEIPHDKK